MEWSFTKETTKENIDKAEKQLNYKFPDDFKECVLHNNRGCPEKNIFYLDDGTERVFNRLLSFNDEEVNIISMNEDYNLIFFADDPFGNFIAFERGSNKIVFWNHEEGEISFVANDWNSFINSLKKMDDR